MGIADATITVQAGTFGMLVHIKDGLLTVLGSTKSLTITVVSVMVCAISVTGLPTPTATLASLAIVCLMTPAHV